VAIVVSFRVVGCLLQRREDDAVAVRCLGHLPCYTKGRGMTRPGARALPTYGTCHCRKPGIELQEECRREKRSAKKCGGRRSLVTPA